MGVRSEADLKRDYLKQACRQVLFHMVRTGDAVSEYHFATCIDGITFAMLNCEKESHKGCLICRNCNLIGVVIVYAAARYR